MLFAGTSCVMGHCTTGDLSVRLKAAPTSAGAQSLFSLPPCSHHVTLGRPVGLGSCAVVFQVKEVRDITQADPVVIRAELVAKVGMSGEESCESATEANILSSLPTHINIIGFHGNFCTVERNQDLECLLGSFATRTVSKGRKARSMIGVSVSKSSKKEELLAPLPSVEADADVTLGNVGELDVQPLIYNFSLLQKCSLSLRDLLKFQTLTESELAFAMTDVLRGLAFVHKHKVLHRDVTEGNLLIADGGLRVVLADFDMSVKTQGPGQVPWTCGTPGFIAPEVLKHGRGCTKSDIFSVGVVAFQAACGKHPFVNEDLLDVQDTARRTVHDEPDFWGGHVLRRSSKCLSFVGQLLQKEADDRPSAKQAICDSWLLSGVASSNLCVAFQRYNKFQPEEEEDKEEEDLQAPRRTGSHLFGRVVRALTTLTSLRSSEKEKKPSKEPKPKSSRGFWTWRSRPDVKFSQIAPAT